MSLQSNLTLSVNDQEVWAEEAAAGTTYPDFTRFFWMVPCTTSSKSSQGNILLNKSSQCWPQKTLPNQHETVAHCLTGRKYHVPTTPSLPLESHNFSLMSLCYREYYSQRLQKQIAHHYSLIYIVLEQVSDSSQRINFFISSRGLQDSHVVVAFSSFFFLLCQFPKRYYMVFENKVFWQSHYGAVFSDLHFMNREKYYCLCPGFLVSKQELLIFPLARVRFCFWLVEEAFVHLKPRNGRRYSPFPFFCT